MEEEKDGCYIAYILGYTCVCVCIFMAYIHGGMGWSLI